MLFFIVKRCSTTKAKQKMTYPIPPTTGQTRDPVATSRSPVCLSVDFDHITFATTIRLSSQTYLVSSLDPVHF